MLLGLYPEDVKQGKMQDIFMAPLVEEMLKLGTEGMWVYDSYLQKRYKSKWFLGTVSADTPARNTIGKFSGVSGYRADYRSLFEGAKFSNINSEGTYFTGYVSQVKQSMFFKDRAVSAYDQSLILNHAWSLELARRVRRSQADLVAWQFGRFEEGQKNYFFRTTRRLTVCPELFPRRPFLALGTKKTRWE